MSDTYTVTVTFESDPLLSAHIKFNTTLNAMTYDGETIAGLSKTKFLYSKITLVNTAGENLYTQNVIIYLP